MKSIWKVRKVKLELRKSVWNKVVKETLLRNCLIVVPFFTIILKMINSKNKPCESIIKVIFLYRIKLVKLNVTLMIKTVEGIII